MIDLLLPATVSAVAVFDDPPDTALFPEEAAVVARAVAKRRQEFATVRWCARRALALLGVGPVPILPGERGAPQWPEGIVGSMTHCSGYRAAAVARATDLVTIGVDAEPNEPVPDGVLDLVTSAEERQPVLSLLNARPDVRWDRLIFSAKESVYKAWFPLTGRWLGFEEAEVTIDPAFGTFRARLLIPGPEVAGVALTGFAGRWCVRRGLLATAIGLPAGSAAAPPQIVPSQVAPLGPRQTPLS